MTEIVNAGVEVVSIDHVQPHPRNPRRGDLSAIRESIRAHGFYGALIVQRSTSFILAGNHRWEAARLEGFAEVPVIYVDVDDDRATRILLADNRTAELATWDEKTLTALLHELADVAGLDSLITTGWNRGDLVDLIGETPRYEAASRDDQSTLDGKEATCPKCGETFYVR